MKSNIREHQILELTQEVREYKKAKDWIAAVRALAQLKVLHGKDWSDTDYAKALQQAGQFDKAIKEIDWLLAHSRQQQDDPGWAHLPQSAKEARHQKQCAEIHKAAALICKREGRSDLEEHHHQLARAYDQERLSLQAAAKRSEHAARKRREAKFEKARAPFRGGQ